MSKRDYDSTVARIAGNLLSGHNTVLFGSGINLAVIALAVEAARAIVAEVKRTEPAALTGEPSSM